MHLCACICVGGSVCVCVCVCVCDCVCGGILISILFSRVKGAFTREKLKIFLKISCIRSTPQSDDGFYIVKVGTDNGIRSIFESLKCGAVIVNKTFIAGLKSW